MNFTLDQLARSGLLPKSESEAILAGKTPSPSVLIPHLVILSRDADAMTGADKSTTGTQRRLSRQLLGLTFLLALLVEHALGPEERAGVRAASKAPEKGHE
jgi:hypothetical protein